MPLSKSPSPRPAWSVWGARVCLFGGALILFGSVLPPILSEVNATIRATSGSIAPRESKVSRPAQPANPPVSQTKVMRFAPPTDPRTNRRSLFAGGTPQDRREILTSYQKWKRAWRTTDLDLCMGLYAPDIRFSDIGRRTYDYNGLKIWFKSIWGETGYQVTDWEPPQLRIRGNRALLFTKQGYGQSRVAALSFISRYVWEKRLDPATNKKRWLIVEEAYLPLNGDQGNNSQIY
jgi:ketosteroid isomerase-like protein